MGLITDIFQDFTEDKWCKWYGARSKYGRKVDTYSPEACKWCMVGWADKETHRQNRPHDLKTVQHYLNMAKPINVSELIVFNDSQSTTWQDIKVMIECARRIEEKIDIFCTYEQVKAEQDATT